MLLLLLCCCPAVAMACPHVAAAICPNHIYGYNLMRSLGCPVQNHKSVMSRLLLCPYIYIGPYVHACPYTYTY